MEASAAARDARDRAHAFEDVGANGAAGVWLGVQRPKIDRGDNDTVGCETGVDRQQVAQGLRKQECADEKHQREGDLQDNERAPERKAFATRRQPAAGAADDAGDVHAGRANGGQQAEEHASEDTG